MMMMMMMMMMMTAVVAVEVVDDDDDDDEEEERADFNDKDFFPVDPIKVSEADLNPVLLTTHSVATLFSQGPC